MPASKAPPIGADPQVRGVLVWVRVDATVAFLDPVLVLTLYCLPHFQHPMLQIHVTEINLENTLLLDAVQKGKVSRNQ